MTDENKLKKIVYLISFWERVVRDKKNWIKRNRNNPYLKVEIPEEKAKIRVFKEVIKNLKRILGKKYVVPKLKAY